MKKAIVLLPLLLFWHPSHATSFSEDGGGVGVYLVGALLLVALIFLGSAFGQLVEIINRVAGKPGDHEFASKALIFGGLGSPMIGALCAAIFGTKASFVADFWFATLLAFVALIWWIHRQR